MEQTPVAVIGYGAVGKAIVRRLTGEGRAVRVIQRSHPADLPISVEFTAGDALDTASITAAIKGCGSVILALGFPYRANIWEQAWPAVMANVLAACETEKVRLVFADNLYMYGPQTLPLTEELPLADYRRKPRSRAVATRLRQKAHSEGKVQAVAVRSSDFYGPGVRQSLLGVPTLGLIPQGKPVLMTSDPDLRHDFTHIEDFARAVVTLLDAPAADYGQAWHVPCSETLTFRQLMSIAADAMGSPLKIRQFGQWQTYLLGMFIRDVAEYREMHFLLDRPYLVDSSRFKARFWCDTVPFDKGIPETVMSFRPAA